VKLMSDPPRNNAAVVRHAAVLAGVGTIGLAGAAWALSGMGMALGIALGALLAMVNLGLTSRAISEMFSDPERHRPARAGGLALPAILLLKWPVLLLALGGVLWYLPARPEGVAEGELERK
jgi:hypothetical protein